MLLYVRRLLCFGLLTGAYTGSLFLHFFGMVVLVHQDRSCSIKSKTKNKQTNIKQTKRYIYIRFLGYMHLVQWNPYELITCVIICHLRCSAQRGSTEWDKEFQFNIWVSFPAKSDFGTLQTDLFRAVQNIRRQTNSRGYSLN